MDHGPKHKSENYKSYRRKYRRKSLQPYNVFLAKSEQLNKTQKHKP